MPTVKPKAEARKQDEVLFSFAFPAPDGTVVAILGTDQADATRKFLKLHPLADGK